MTKIKFRGKRIDNGKWVYGSYVCLDYHNGVDYIESHQIILSNGHSFEVDQKTVGQYIGFNDKNEKEIYENDIVKYFDFDFSINHGDNYENKGVVRYDEGSLMYHISNRNEVSNEKAWMDDTLEVIGNTCENPNL